MAFSDTLIRCKASWQKQGIRLGPALSEDMIRETWSRLGRRVSRDVVALYSTLGGFAEYELDSDFFWSLWPWTMVKERNQVKLGDGVLFCDHSIEICTWELRYESDDISSVWLIQHGHQTAPSLEMFFESYLQDPWTLL
jgi:hypothetical protein